MAAMPDAVATQLSPPSSAASQPRLNRIEPTDASAPALLIAGYRDRPDISRGLADVLTLVVIATSVMLSVARLSHAASRSLRGSMEYFLPLLIGLCFVLTAVGQRRRLAGGHRSCGQGAGSSS